MTLAVLIEIPMTVRESHVRSGHRVLVMLTRSLQAFLFLNYNGTVTSRLILWSRTYLDIRSSTCGELGHLLQRDGG